MHSIWDLKALGIMCQPATDHECVKKITSAVGAATMHVTAQPIKVRVRYVGIPVFVLLRHEGDTVASRRDAANERGRKMRLVREQRIRWRNSGWALESMKILWENERIWEVECRVDMEMNLPGVRVGILR